MFQVFSVEDHLYILQGSRPPSPDATSSEASVEMEAQQHTPGRANDMEQSLGTVTH